jgi:hypothetical protein
VGCRRDVGFDSRLPQPERWFCPESSASANCNRFGPGHAVTSLKDQHCWLEIPVDSPLLVGDMTSFGIPLHLQQMARHLHRRRVSTIRTLF